MTPAETPRMTDREKAAGHLQDAADHIEAAIRCAFGAAVSSPIASNFLTENCILGPKEEITSAEYARLTDRLTETRDQLRNTAVAIQPPGEAPEQ